MGVMPLVMYRLIGTRSPHGDYAEVVNRMFSTDISSHCHVSLLSNEYCVHRHYKLKTHVRVLLLLSSFAFRDLKFCLSIQLMAASCARWSSDIPPPAVSVRNLFSRFHWPMVGPVQVAGWYGHYNPVR